MKKGIIASILVLCLQMLQAQVNTAAIDMQIARIQKELVSCQHEEQVKTATAFREVYKKGNQVCLVRVRSLENETDKDVTWYFVDNALVYCETTWVDFRGIVTFSEAHYLDNNQLISWTENNEKISPESAKFKARTELLKVAGEELLTKVQP
jgi:hypothetical protein